MLLPLSRINILYIPTFETLKMFEPQSQMAIFTV